jgi:hypothetical protein
VARCGVMPCAELWASSAWMKPKQKTTDIREVNPSTLELHMGAAPRLELCSTRQLNHAGFFDFAPS